MNSFRRTLAPGLILAAVLGIPACGKNSTGPQQGTSFTITASAGTNGSISPSGAVTVASGANQTFTITPVANASVQDVHVDGGSVGAVGTYTFTNVTANHTIHALFTAPVLELNSGVILPGNQYAHTFTTAGTYPYFCTIHGTTMNGSVTVATGEPASSSVSITNNAYTPQHVTVAPGGTVTWTNNGSQHTVTSQ